MGAARIILAKKLGSMGARSPGSSPWGHQAAAAATKKPKNWPNKAISTICILFKNVLVNYPRISTMAASVTPWPL